MTRTSLLIAVALAILGVLAPQAGAATYPAGFAERTIASGLSGPTGVAWAPDGRMFVIEKAGRLKVVPPGGGTAGTVLDISSKVNSYWDRGLLGVAVDSSFATNGYVYLLYTYDLQPLTPDSDRPMNSRLTRIKVNPDNTLENPAAPETTLLGSYVSGVCPAPSNTLDCVPSEGFSHSIGSVRSAPDGTLYVGSGDASSWSTVDRTALRTYDERSLAGKILRIDRNGRGIAGHPFCPANADLTQACTKIWAKGFRNPFRFKLRPNGGLAVGDVGWNTREEVDLVSTGGRSYGWPCYEGTVRTPGYRDLTECAGEYAREGTASAHTAPNHDYAHSGSASVQGGPTYRGALYPAGYRDQVFFSDYSSGAIKRMTVDSQDRVSNVTDFASGWSGTDLEAGPTGDLVYVDYGGAPGTGSVKQIVYTEGNRAPVARASATPTSGASPLTVQLTGSGSSDPDGDPLTYSWDFGDGSAGSTQANPSHTYTNPGTRTATLTVRDGRGLSATASVQITAGGSAPTVKIETPADESLYQNGDTVSLRGSATDAQDGALPGTKLDWDVKLFHGTHVHPVTQVNGTATASFTAQRDHDADSHYEITLRATDASGLTSSETIQVRPRTADFSIESDPVGAPVSYGGRDVASPFSTQAAVGFRTTVSAAASFTSGGRTYEFDRWSDGGERSHEITVPATSSTLRASYREVEDKAHRRPATASSSEAAWHSPDLAVDGDPASRWASQWADGQWWQVDLGRSRQVDKVDLVWEDAYAARYRVMTSPDGITFSEAANVTSTGPGLRSTTFAARSARYVRVEVLQRGTAYGVSLFDARVYGPADPAVPPAQDKALGRTATASSFEDVGFEAGKAVDGDPASRWSSAFADDQWWQVDLGSGRQVDRLEVDWEGAYASRYKILTSLDGVNFSEAADVSLFQATLRETTFTPRLARYVRVVALTRATVWGVSFFRASVFGPDETADTTAPDTSITSGPSGTVTSESASFAFTATESGSTFECQLDAGAWSACASPKALANLAAGSHTFEVRAKDAAGNTDATPASRTWTVASTEPAEDKALGRTATASTTEGNWLAPQLAVDGDPTTRWASAWADAQWWQVDLGRARQVDRVVLDWEDAYATRYRILTSLDGTNFAQAAETSALTPGAHTTTFAARSARYVRVQAVERATLYGISLWSARVYGPADTTTDTTPPDTSLSSGPSGATASASASFDFASTEAGSTFECRLDSGAWAGCTSPRAYSALPAGSHTFEVRARDAAGNTDATPASRTWTVDTTAPDTTISSGPSGTVTGNSASFAFTSEASASFECRLDAGAWAACSSPKAYAGLANGSHTFAVRAKDAAGNTDATPATRTWTVNVPADYRATVLGTSALSSYWRLGDTGTSAADSKGTNTGAYVNGPSPSPSLIARDTNPARDFDGANDLVDLSPTPFGTPAAFSVETWVKLDTTKPAGGYHFLATNSSDDLNNGFSLVVNSANEPMLVTARSATQKGSATSSVPLTPGAAYHLVATYDGATLRLYVNGVLRRSTAYSGGVAWASGRDLLLGAQRKSYKRSSRYLDGKLDETALYTRALSAAEAGAHYDAGR